MELRLIFLLRVKDMRVNLSWLHEKTLVDTLIVISRIHTFFLFPFALYIHNLLLLHKFYCKLREWSFIFDVNRKRLKINLLLHILPYVTFNFFKIFIDLKRNQFNFKSNRSRWPPFWYLLFVIFTSVFCFFVLKL